MYSAYVGGFHVGQRQDVHAFQLQRGVYVTTLGLGSEAARARCNVLTKSTIASAREGAAVKHENVWDRPYAPTSLGRQ